MASSIGKNRRLTITEVDESDSFLTKFTAAVSDSPIVYRTKAAASETLRVSGKLAKSTGKAAWIVGTTMLILVVPLIIVMDRESQFNELDMQQATLLGTPSG